MKTWQCALELDSNRNVVSGDSRKLSEAIGRAADLRIVTEFRHNEHIDVASPNSELIREVAEFGVTYLLDQKWVSGIMSLRQPIELPHGFGPRPSMSYFLYNQDGSQAIARPYLDGRDPKVSPLSSMATSSVEMPKYHLFDSFDVETNAPSQNFIYDFDLFRYCVNDTWTELLHHSSDGKVVSGSLDELVDAFSSGCAIKLGIQGLCSDLAVGPLATNTQHEVFVHGGSAYYYSQSKLLLIGTHPVIRVAPQVPLKYGSRNWDFGWLLVRSDGNVVYRQCDPNTLRFTDHQSKHSVRWFVR